MSMNNFLNELEHSLDTLDIPYEKYNCNPRSCDEWIYYPSRNMPRYAYQIERCPWCGNACEANLFDYTSEGGDPNRICCTPESAIAYILDDWAEREYSELVACPFEYYQEEMAHSFAVHLKTTVYKPPEYYVRGPIYNETLNKWIVYVERKEDDDDETASET